VHAFTNKAPIFLTSFRPQISECAVVGVTSDAWGQKVAAVVVLSELGLKAGRGGKPWGPLDLRRALKDRLANYKIPQEMKVIENIPRNAMGKSKHLLKACRGEDANDSETSQ
jgi:malonyl-CoA/methylmalonyl-CoA synthetase